MNNQEEKFTTPVGRIVQGSLYKKYDKMEKKEGDSPHYYIALAVPKGTEQHWNQTEWGAHLWNYTLKLYGGTVAANFTWKVDDGNDATPNGKGNRDCDREGFPGHWILRLKSNFAPSIHDCTLPGKPVIETSDTVLPGDWIQVRIGIGKSKKEMNPTHFLNPLMIGFVKHGERITVFEAEDANAVGFVQAPPSAPPAVMATQGIAIAPAAYQAPAPQAAYQAPVAPPLAVQPHLGILNAPQAAYQAPVAPPPTGRQMTAKANGGTYEQWVAVGWTDAMLIKDGYMTV